MKLSHAGCGYPRWTGHGGEFWQKMVHWRREWQTTSVFLFWEPHEQYERQKDRPLKDELPRSVGAQYATRDQWRNNSRKTEEMEPKQNNTQLWMWLVMEVKSDAVKSNNLPEEILIQFILKIGFSQLPWKVFYKTALLRFNSSII